MLWKESKNSEKCGVAFLSICGVGRMWPSANEGQGAGECLVTTAVCRIKTRRLVETFTKMSMALLGDELLPMADH